MDIKIQRVSTPKEKVDATKVPFGTYFTDHMFLMDYETGKGWFNARIVPYGKLAFDAAATVYHYATEIFEGLKAYRTPEGNVQLFRPIENVRRMNNSASRMSLPQMDEDMMLEALLKFVSFEKDWVPDKPGTSLYLRPFLVAVDPCLSLHPVHQCVFCIIACPVGSYFPNGLKPVPILIEEHDVRAVRGGTGYAKCGGNYAGAMRASDRAEAKGFSQVLWIDGVERKYVEEAGGMNVMFQINGEIVTPELNGSVLPGITRKSCIEVMRGWGMKVAERLLSLDELLDACKTGALEEAWCCGTAAVIAPIGELAYGDARYIVNNNQIGRTTRRLYDEITGIQWGLVPDKYHWAVTVE